MLSIQDAQQQIEKMMDTIMLYQRRKPLFDRLGRALLSDIHMNFRRQRAPDGTPWAPLKIRRGQILRDTGRLRNSITYKPADEQVTVGTNVLYARTHHFGATITPKRKKVLAFPGPGGKTIFAKKVVIPARPFLAIEQPQINIVHETIERWVRDIAAKSAGKSKGRK